ncbi:restriction endonuclease subunit S [Shewanella oncorhynchi]|uniref:restriction endonuclease subunit S n=1 Tax=Shewanella oncorhynchi TaxID=2726434 RepID=UPI003D791219
MRKAHSTFDYSSMSNSSLITDTPLGYKQTEVGIIPDDWECVPSKEMISYLGGYAFSSRSAKSDGIRWLKIANVGVNEVKWEAESYLPNSFSENHSDYLLAESDVVMALTRPLLGEKLKVATLSKFDIPALLNQRVAKLSAKNSCNQKYIYYLVQTSGYISAMNLAMAGSDPPNIGTKTLGDILIAIPSSRAEQTAIANALSDVDALIQELEKLIAKKQAIKTATMQQLLTGRTRLPAFAYEKSAHHPDGRKKGYKPSELGEIPEDWEVYSLSSICDVRDGTHDSPKYRDNGIPLVTSKNIVNDVLDLTDVSLISISDASEINKRSKVDKGDIIMSMIGTVGSAVLLRQEPEFCIKNVALFKPRGVLGEFLVQLIRSKFFQDYLVNSMDGGIQKFVSLGTLRNMQTALPTKDEQSILAEIMCDMDKEIQALELRLSKTRQIKQGMMQELLTGKTRLVKPAGAA